MNANLSITKGIKKEKVKVIFLEDTMSGKQKEKGCTIEIKKKKKRKAMATTNYCRNPMVNKKKTMT